MELENFKVGMPVMYIPNHLIDAEEINDNDLGIVTSVNNRYVFVQYFNQNNSQATNPNNLHSLEYRPDLIERLGLVVESINEICKSYIKGKQAINEGYFLVRFPEVQEYMEEEWFDDEAIFCGGSEDKTGNSAYFIPINKIKQL